MPIENWSDQVMVVHLSNDPQFTEDLETLEDSRKKTPRDVVLDFSAVRFINSSNLSRLLRLRKQTLAEGRRLVLCGLTNQIWSALLVTGLDKIFEFSEGVPTALATIAMEEAEEEEEAEQEAEVERVEAKGKAGEGKAKSRAKKKSK